MLFAQQVVGGGADVTTWIQIATQGGSFALLAWAIIVFAPKLLKELREEREKVQAEHRAERKEMGGDFMEAVKEQQHGFNERHKDLKDAIETQTERLCGAFDSDTREKFHVAVEALLRGGFCKAHDEAEIIAQKVLEKMEKYGGGNVGS